MASMVMMPAISVPRAEAPLNIIGRHNTGDTVYHAYVFSSLKAASQTLRFLGKR